MSLYKAETVLKRMRDGRCAKALERLAADEFVLCKHCAPKLYLSSLLAEDKSQIELLIQGLVASPGEVRRAILNDTEVAFQLERFFRLLFRKGTDSLEWFLHVYLYLFWGTHRFDSRCEGMQSGRLYWLAKGAPEGVKIEPDSREPVDIALKYLADQGVEVDLASYDKDRQTLWIVELKRGDLDDRAVGQMIRYFDRAARCLPSREFRRADINFLRSVVLLESVDPRRWIALPLHFRELLDIYSFRSDDRETKSFGSSAIAFQSLRRQMLSTP